MRYPKHISAFALYLLCSLYGVWVRFSIELAVVRGAEAISGDLPLPTGFHLALHLGSSFVFLPFALIGVWLLSGRFKVLRSEFGLAVYGVTMATAYLTYGWFLLTPLLARGLYL